MAEPLAGQILRAGDSPAPRFRQKSGTETVSASTAMQDDNDFALLPLAASKVYRVEVYLAISASASGNYQQQWVYSAGVAQLTARHQVGPFATSTSSTNTAVNLNVTNPTSAFGFGVTSTSGTVSVRQEFILETTTSGIAGTITLQWAQGTSSGTTSLSNSSYVIITEVEPM